jgi:hypothetical protein
MGIIDYETRQGFDRRIGRRVPVDAIPVELVVARTGRLGTKKAPLEVSGCIEDVSVTGVGITGPADLPLQPGDSAVLRHDGRESVVVLRHRRPTEHPSIVRYGVELTRAHPALRRRIDAALTADSSGRPAAGSHADAAAAGSVLDLSDRWPLLDLIDGSLPG